MSALLLAAAQGRADIVKLLLTVNTEDPGIPVACLSDANWLLFEELFGADETDLTSPLLEACDGGHNATVRLLADARSSLDHAAPSGEVPLITAVRGGHVGVVELLLDAKARNLDAAYNHACFTALYFAASAGHLAIVELLISARADHKRRPPGKGPLDTAASHGHAEIVKKLLDAGASDPCGQASSAAYRLGHHGIYAMLA